MGVQRAHSEVRSGIMNLAEGETKGRTSTKLLFFPVGALKLAQKQIHLEVLLLRLCYAAWRASMKNQEISKKSFMCGFSSSDIILAVTCHVFK